MPSAYEGTDIISYLQRKYIIRLCRIYIISRQRYIIENNNKLWYNQLDNLNLAKECSCMKMKKLLFAILCALGSGTVGFFANQLTEVYGCILFGIGVGLMVYSMINLSK